MATVMDMWDGCETEAPTEAPADTKQVKFKMTINMKAEKFETCKDKIVEDIATTLQTTKDKVSVAIVTRRLRRLLADSVDLEVTVKAKDAAAADAIKQKVSGESSTFKADLAAAVKASTGETITVSEVSDPTSENLTTSTDDDKDNTTMIIIIVVAVVVVLLIGGFVCYTMNKNETMSKEVGGGEFNEKRTPGTQA